MCVMIIQDNNKFPGWDMLHDAFVANPDGAGFMYQENAKVHILKGLMTYDAFKSALEKVENYQTRNIVYHFRIGTHGSKTSSNTHPYPVTNKIDSYKKLDVVTNAGFAHNGIIDEKFYSKKLQKAHNITDSAATLHRIVTEGIKGNELDIASVIEKLDVISNNKAGYGDRFAIMTPTNIYTSGNWKEYKGFKVSNLLFTYKSHVYGKAGNYGLDYDYYDDYYYKTPTNTYKNTSNSNVQAIERHIYDFVTKELAPYETSVTQLKEISSDLFDLLKHELKENIVLYDLKLKSNKKDKKEIVAYKYGFKNTKTNKFLWYYSNIIKTHAFTDSPVFAQKFIWNDAVTAYDQLVRSIKDPIKFVAFNERNEVISEFFYNRKQN